jgi:hypothetical protein
MLFAASGERKPVVRITGIFGHFHGAEPLGHIHLRPALDIGDNQINV